MSFKTKKKIMEIPPKMKSEMVSEEYGIISIEVGLNVEIKKSDQKRPYTKSLRTGYIGVGRFKEINYRVLIQVRY